MLLVLAYVKKYYNIGLHEVIIVGLIVLLLLLIVIVDIIVDSFVVHMCHVLLYVCRPTFYKHTTTTCRTRPTYLVVVVGLVLSLWCLIDCKCEL